MTAMINCIFILILEVTKIEYSIKHPFLELNSNEGIKTLSILRYISVFFHSYILSISRKDILSISRKD